MGTRSLKQTLPHESTHRDEGNFLVLFIARNTLSARVKQRLSIDNEQIVMMPVAQRYFRAPGAVGHPAHGMGRAIPIVEVPSDENLLGLRREAEKWNRFDDILGGIAVRLDGRVIAEGLHVLQLDSSCSSLSYIRFVAGEINTALAFSQVAA